MAGENLNYNLNIGISQAEQSLGKISQQINKLGDKSKANSGIVNQRDLVSMSKGLQDAVNQVNALQGQFGKLQSSSPFKNKLGIQIAKANLEEYRKEVNRVVSDANRALAGTSVKPNKQFQSNYHAIGAPKQNNYERIFSDSDSFSKAMASQRQQIRSEQRQALNMAEKANRGYINGADMGRIQSAGKNLQHHRQLQDDLISQQGERKTRLMAIDKQLGSMPASDANTPKYKGLVEESTRLQKEYQDLGKTIGDLNKSFDVLARLSSSKENIQAVTPRRGSMASIAYDRAPSLAMGIVGVTAGVVANDYSKGGQIKQQEAGDFRSIGTGTGSFDYVGTRRRAERAGYGYGMTGSDMLSTENAFMTGTGIRNESSLIDAAKSTALLSRSTGQSMQDASSLTANYAVGTNGASANSLRQFQEIFVGGLKQSGMVGQSKEQLTAMTSLLGAVSQNRGSLTANEANQFASMQSLLGKSGDKSMQGQQGAQMLSSLDAGIRSSGDNPAYMTAMQMYNPRKYNGTMAGYLNMQVASQQGLTNKDNVGAWNAMGRMAGFQNMTKEQREAGYSGLAKRMWGTNLNMQQAGYLDKISNNGQLSKALSSSQMKHLRSLGTTEEQRNLKGYNSTQDSKEQKYNAALQQTQTRMNDLGAGVKALIAPVYMATGGFGTLIRATGALVAAFGSAAASMGLAGGIKDAATIGSTAEARGMSRSAVLAERYRNSKFGKSKLGQKLSGYATEAKGSFDEASGKSSSANASSETNQGRNSVPDEESTKENVAKDTAVNNKSTNTLSRGMQDSATLGASLRNPNSTSSKAYSIINPKTGQPFVYKGNVKNASEQTPRNVSSIINPKTGKPFPRQSHSMDSQVNSKENLGESATNDVKAKGFRGRLGEYASTVSRKSGGFLGKVANKASGLTSKVTESKVGGGLLKTAGTVGKVADRAMPWLAAGLGAFDTYSQYQTDKQNKVSTKTRRSDVGQGLGSTAGGIAGATLGSFLGPLGMIAGSAIGGWAGGKLGGWLGGATAGSGESNKSSKKKESSVHRKEEDSLSTKEQAAQKQRARNIKDDKSVADEYMRLYTGPYKNKVNGGRTQERESSDDSSSDSPGKGSILDTKAVNLLKATSSNLASQSANGSGGTLQVVVSGTVNHQGTVTDMSQVEASTTAVGNIPIDLLSKINPNETVRR